jgi:hypothetical protein
MITAEALAAPASATKLNSAPAPIPYHKIERAFRISVMLGIARWTARATVAVCRTITKEDLAAHP